MEQYKQQIEERNESEKAPNMEIKNKPRRKFFVIFLVIFLAILVLALLWFVFDKNTTSLETAIQKDDTIETASDEINDEIVGMEGWQEYRDDVFGLEFKYPVEWGEPYVNNFYHLTDLSVVNKEYAREEFKVNFSDEVFRLVFSNLDYQSALKISKMNDQEPDKNELKLVNGYFDYLHIPKSFTTDDGIVVEEELYDKFFRSINVYKPNVEEKIVTAMPEEGDDNLKAIVKYYNYISSGDLEKAYGMYNEKKVSFNDYEGWYEHTAIAKPYDFELLQDNNYRFFVDFQDANKKRQTYRVIMKVENGTINTISSEEILSEEVSGKGVKVFTKNYRGYNYVVMEKNGEEIVIDRAPDDSLKDIENALFFTGLKFSPSGKYLKYSAYGWEWGFGRIYDIENGRKVLELYSPFVFDFVDSEKYLYACANNQMTGEMYARVYNTSSFEIKEEVDLNQIYLELDCDYNIEEKTLSVHAYASTATSEKKAVIDLR